MYSHFLRTLACRIRRLHQPMTMIVAWTDGRPHVATYCPSCDRRTPPAV